MRRCPHALFLRRIFNALFIEYAMAVERINPFEQEDRFAVDHLLRYLWAKPLVEEKKTIDIACGLGFGTIMLADGNASEVIGIDSDEEAIRYCSGLWDHPKASFKAGLIEDLPRLVADNVDCIVSFETLEHIPDPKVAVKAIKSVLGEGGLFIGSVPGETDLYEDNEFHLHSFDERRLRMLLEDEFGNVLILKQRFHLASVIEAQRAGGADVINSSTMDAVKIDFGRTTGSADSLVFLASDSPLPTAFGQHLCLSREAWLKDFVRAQTYGKELKALSVKFMELFSRHNKLFFEHGDLQRKFTNVLGWGSYHYKVVHGNEPEKHYLETIEAAKSAREKALMAEVLSLQAQIRELKEPQAEPPVAEEEVRKAGDAFIKGCQNLPNRPSEDQQ